MKFWRWMAIGLGVVLAGAAEAAPVVQVIPLQTATGGVQTIEASIDGKRGTFLFDSGFGVSAVTPVMAKRINCRPWGRITGFRAIGERVDSKQCQPVVLDINGFVTGLPTVTLIDLQQYMPPKSPEYAGAVGLDAFADKIVTLRTRANQIVVETRNSMRSRISHATAIPVRLVREAQGASLTVFAGVQTAAGMLWMELDTGNTGPTMVAKHASALVGLDPGQPHGQSLSMPLAKGIVVTGAVQVLDVIIDGNIGHDFLEKWDVTLDLAAGKAWLSPATT